MASPTTLGLSIGPDLFYNLTGMNGDCQLFMELDVLVASTSWHHGTTVYAIKQHQGIIGSTFSACTVPVFDYGQLAKWVYREVLHRG